MEYAFDGPGSVPITSQLLKLGRSAHALCYAIRGRAQRKGCVMKPKSKGEREGT